MLLDLEQIDKTKLNSKFLKEYISFKEANPDAILLFQIGDFWETFFKDARIFSEITGVTLGSRPIKDLGSILQAGISIKASLNFYLKKLLNENYKICLCAQFEDENKELYRKIIRTYTKGTIIENEFLDSQENNYILAACQLKNNWHIAYADVSTGQFYKTNTTFEQAKLEIEKIEPNELLILKSQCDFFKEYIPKFNTTLLEDEIYADKKIEDILLKYCLETQKSYIVKLDKIIEYTPCAFLSMDEITRRNLELTRTRRFLKKKGSLLWFLNYTKTPMGSRMLRKYLDEPLLDVAEIKNRQNAVEELVLNEKLLKELEIILENFCDLSRMCAKISNSTIYPKDLYQIVTNAKALEDLSKISKNFKSKLLKVDENKLSQTLELANKIKSSISADSNNEITKGGVINEGYYSELDYLREKLKNTENELLKYEKDERKRLDIEKLKIGWNRNIGYYIEVPSSKETKLSGDYRKKHTLSTCSRHWTNELQGFQDKIYNLRYQISELEYDIYCQIRKEAAKFVDTIRELAKDISRIDVLVSYSRCAIINNLVRPEFNKKKMFVKDGFHPSLLKLKNEIVKNDTNIENGSMIILTGANMSGKSTYLKHNAIVCLLSQIGSFIPADHADLTIIDKIFIRQNSTDDIVNNNSSFMVEMNDLKFIIDNITNSSFVFLDEPAKSTNAAEGGAIARAFCEYLLKFSKAKIMLATHNIELTKIEDLFPNRAFNYVIGNSDSTEKIISNRKIRRGIMNSSLAINTAILANLPLEIITNAKKYIGC